MTVRSKPLPRTPESDVKKLGWRGVMRAVQQHGRMLVTQHDQPEAVILPVAEYQALLARVERAEADAESMLAALRQRFDQRLAVLQAADAGERLRGIVSGPARLHGQVKAGQTT